MFKRLVGCVVGVALSLSVAPHAFATPDVVAHQGYGHSTAYSYASAARTGATLEGDLQLTKDNKVVVYHDARLERKCKGKTLIKKLKWKQIRKCDPTVIQLGTLLGIAKSRHAKVSLEFKANGGKKWTKKKMKKVYRELRKHGMLNHNTEIYSFKTYHISKWRSIGGWRTLTGLNVNSRGGLSPSYLKRYGGRVAIKNSIVSAETVKRLQDNGIYVAIYTANRANMKSIQDKNPDAIITDIRI